MFSKSILDPMVTNMDSSVYLFTKKASPFLVAAAMARLSRCSDDMRIILLREFLHDSGESAEALYDRVLTEYGDDSVAQLMVFQLVVEGASNLLTKKLEWGRLAAYLETSTRYIYFDKKNSEGNYRYYVPGNLPDILKDEYRAAMDTIFEMYSEVVHAITHYVRGKIVEPVDSRERSAWLSATRAQACDAARSLLPVATQSTVGIVASAQSMESLILHLVSEPLLECRDTGLKILTEARRVASPFFKRTDMPERGGATVVYHMDTRKAMREISQKFFGRRQTATFFDSVKLVDYWPRDECDLIPGMLFAESDNTSLECIKRGVAGLSREEKEGILRDYCGRRLNRRHKPGRALEKAHYEWVVDSSYGVFRDLQRHRMVDAWEWQRLTPYTDPVVMPELVYEAGFSRQFKACFERSKELYERLMSEGFEEEAQYAVLLGHRMRCHFIMNAREAFHLIELRTQPQGHPEYRKIAQNMHEKICRVHPTIGKAMIFVNKGEDPELTRIAAEIATQRKLALLERK